MNENKIIPQVVAAMTIGQRNALLALDGDWQAGPDLADSVIDEVETLRNKGFVDRKFADMGSPDIDEKIDGVSIHVGACWWFKPSAIGDSVREHLSGSLRA